MTFTALPGQNSPALHHFKSVGLELHFQDGAVGQYGYNGTTNEEVIRVLLARIRSLNEMENNRFRCEENDHALMCLEQALSWLQERTRRRELRGVEGRNVP